MHSVLIVEDEFLLLKVLADALTDSGFNTVEASSAEEALRILSSQHIDLVLSDIRMPGMSGIELANVNQNSDSPVPFILMTGYPAGSIPDWVLARDIQVLRKPLDIDELAAQIGRRLEAKTE